MDRLVAAQWSEHHLVWSVTLDGNIYIYIHTFVIHIPIITFPILSLSLSLLYGFIVISSLWMLLLHRYFFDYYWSICAYFDSSPLLLCHVLEWLCHDDTWAQLMHELPLQQARLSETVLDSGLLWGTSQGGIWYQLEWWCAIWTFDSLSLSWHSICDSEEDGCSTWSPKIFR